LQIKNVNGQSVAWFRAFDVKRAGERVVAFHHRKGVARFLKRIAKAIQGVRVEDIPRFEARNGRSDTEDVLHGVDRGVILNDFGFGWRRGSLSQRRVRQEQTENNEMNTHKGPPENKRGSATHSLRGVNPRPQEAGSAARSAILLP